MMTTWQRWEIEGLGIGDFLDYCGYIHSDLPALPLSTALKLTIYPYNWQLIVALCIVKPPHNDNSQPYDHLPIRWPA
jgi:hypothetical protein